MYKLLFLIFIFSFCFSKDEIIDYQIYKSLSTKIDTNNIIYKKEIFFGKKEDYEKMKISLLNSFDNSIHLKEEKSNILSFIPNIGLYGSSSSGFGVSLGLGFNLPKNNENKTFEYLRVVEIKDKNNSVSNEFILFMSENKSYTKNDIREIINMEIR